MNTKKLLLAILLGFKSITLLGSEEEEEEEEEEDKNPKERHLSLRFNESPEYQKAQKYLEENPDSDRNRIAAHFALQYAIRENKEREKVRNNKQSNQ